MFRVAVIGAGSAGLCMARYLNARPDIYTTVVYEQTKNVGGTWVYTDSTDVDEHGLPIHSSMYKNLRTNLPKQVMAFPDFPFPDNLSSFMTHSEVYKYLEDYTDHFSLRGLIRFNHLVEHVVPKAQANTEKQQWEITVKDLTSQESTTSIFDAVVVCVGHYSDPKIPTIPGIENFPGTIMHSHNYRSPGMFSGKRVVIVGAGASGIDISIELCDKAQAVYLSHHGNRVTCPLPDNLQQLKDVVNIENDGAVVFGGGEKQQADIIMFCTGYLYTFPFLDDKCGIAVHDSRITHLYKHLFNIKYPSMSFIGLPIRICPFPQFSLQARLIEAFLSNKTVLPSAKEMIEDEENDYQNKLSEGLKHHYAHYLGPRQWDYNQELTELAQCDPINPLVQQLYQYCWHYRKKHVMTYKNKNFITNSAGQFEELN